MSWVWQHSMKIFNSSASIVILCYSRVIPCGIVPTLGTWNLELVFFLKDFSKFLTLQFSEFLENCNDMLFFFSTFLGGYYTAIVLWFLNCVVLLQNFGVIKANDTLALTQFHRQLIAGCHKGQHGRCQTVIQAFNRNASSFSFFACVCIYKERRTCATLIHLRRRILQSCKASRSVPNHNIYIY